MTDQPADVIAALVALLKADEGVSGLAGVNVFGGELPRDQNDNMPMYAVIVAPAGGGGIGRAYQRYGDSRVEITCYAPASLNEAWQLYLAVAAAMKEIRSTVSAGVLIYWARSSAKGVLDRDPTTQWPWAYSAWQVLAAEVVDV